MVLQREMFTNFYFVISTILCLHIINTFTSTILYCTCPTAVLYMSCMYDGLGIVDLHFYNSMSITTSGFDIFILVNIFFTDYNS